MKVLVATKEKQGMRKNDFSFTREGELVTFTGMECDGEKVDGNCGCRRSMCGVETHKATTTFKVVDMPIEKEVFYECLKINLVSTGWAGLMGKDKAWAIVFKDVMELMSLADKFEVGTVLEKRGGTIQVRTNVKEEIDCGWMSTPSVEGRFTVRIYHDGSAELFLVDVKNKTERSFRKSYDIISLKEEGYARKIEYMEER